MAQDQEGEPLPADRNRIGQFAVFFKNYMGVSSVVVAALPIPVTSLNLVPVNPADRGSLSVITSLTCFLVLAFIFYTRHSIARSMFGRRSFQRVSWIPLLVLVLILAAVGLFFAYTELFLGLPEHPGPSTRVMLMALYTGFFACAEAAFVLMATKEYLQDLMGLSEHELIVAERQGVGILTERIWGAPARAKDARPDA